MKRTPGGGQVVPTEASEDALSLIELPTTASAVMVDGRTGKVVLLCRGRGVQLRGRSMAPRSFDSAAVG